MENERSLDENDFVPVKEDYFSIKPSSTERHIVCTYDVVEGSSSCHVKISVQGVSGVFQDASNEIESEFSFEKLTSLHQRLVELFPGQIEASALPALPQKPGGIWGVPRLESGCHSRGVV